MAKHNPGTFWPLHRVGKYPNGYIQTASDQEIAICFVPDEESDAGCFNLSRRDARLLAKRILQCLEATK